VNLSEKAGLTSGYQIGLSWDQAPYNGGSEVLDYTVLYSAVPVTQYTVYTSGLLNSNIIITGLNPDTIYEFVV
jgi:hypothetical protein